MIHLLTIAIVHAAAAWTIEKRPDVLNAEIKKTRLPGAEVSARDLDVVYRYPCNADGETEARESDGSERPRYLVRDATQNELWICALPGALRQMTPERVRVLESFSIYLRGPKTSLQRIAVEGEVMARAYDVQIEPDALVLTKSFVFGEGRLVPFTSARLACTRAGCQIGKEKCLLKADGLEAKKELKSFDDLVVAYRKKRGLGTPPLELDRLLILAATGNSGARSRIEKYPLNINDQTESTEILGTYRMYLDEARKVGCGR